MQNFIAKMLLLNKAGEAGGGPPPPPKPDAPATPASPPAPKAEGDKEFDQFGYEIPKEKTPVPGDKGKEGDKPPQTPPAPPAKVEKPATGYDKEDPPVEDPPAEEKPPEPPAPPPTDLDKKLEGIHKAFIDEVKAEIADLGLKGEQLDKFIARRKAEQAKSDEWAANREKEIKRQKLEQNRQWKKELKEDPAFGGEKFEYNVTAAEKFLDEYGAEFKKELTDNEQMLRPSVMRMLARAWIDRNPEPVHAQGDPPAAQSEEETEESNPLDFYTN